MSGRFLNNFVVSIVYLVFAQSIIIHSIETTNQVGHNFSLNGYKFDNTNIHYNKGIRLQGIGDFFFKSKSYTKALSYYEQALKFLPLEADIMFRLGEIYQHEKLWRLSILYYEETIKVLQHEINFNKSQLNMYISRIRIAYIYHLQGNKDKSLKMLKELRQERSLLLSSYPEAWKELKIFDTIYPESPVRTSLNLN